MQNVKPYILATDITQPRVPLGGGLVALPPGSAECERRIVELAEAWGVVAAPRILSARCSENDAGSSVLTFDIAADGTEGPVFVVGIDVASRLNLCRVQMQSGARKLIEGRAVRVVDAFVTPLEESRSFHAPIVILRDDVLSVTLDGSDADVNVSFEVGDRVLARCLVLRSRDGSRLAGVADEIARFIMSEGEWYAIGTSFKPGSTSDQSTANVNNDMMVQAVMVSAPTSVVEGAVQAVSVKASIGNFDVTPLQGMLTGTITLGDSTQTDIALYQPHLRYPVRRGQRVDVRGEYPPTGTPQTVRFVCLGRRLIGASLVDLA